MSNITTGSSTMSKPTTAPPLGASKSQNDFNVDSCKTHPGREKLKCDNKIIILFFLQKFDKTFWEAPDDRKTPFMVALVSDLPCITGVLLFSLT
jgi:hypothetical protein